MRKELIDRLKSYIPSGDGHNSQYANDLANAVELLEAKAAPVGDDRGHDTKGSRKALGAMNAKLKAKIGRLERELAAHQRQQAREVVMPDDLSELLTEIVDIHRRRGVVLTIHIEQIADMLARLNKGAGSHE